MLMAPTMLLSPGQLGWLRRSSALVSARVRTLHTRIQFILTCNRILSDFPLVQRTRGPLSMHPIHTRRRCRGPLVQCPPRIRNRNCLYCRWSWRRDIPGDNPLRGPQDWLPLGHPHNRTSVRRALPDSLSPTKNPTPA